MKPATIFFAGVLALGLSAGHAAQKTNTHRPVPPQPMPEAATPVSGFTERQIVETWGWIIAQEKNVARIEINETELSAWLRSILFRAETASCGTSRTR